MTKRIPIKIKTDKDIINEYGYGYADLMDLFDVSRQMAYNYLTGISRPALERLREVAISKSDEIEGKMCREILANRGFVVIEGQAVTG